MVELDPAVAKLLEDLHLLIETARRRGRLDAEQRVLVVSAQKITCKVRYVILGEVPPAQYPARYVDPVIAMAARAEVLAEVLAVTVSLGITCQQHKPMKTQQIENRV